jgi:hypothetical protein
MPTPSSIIGSLLLSPLILAMLQLLNVPFNLLL